MSKLVVPNEKMSNEKNVKNVTECVMPNRLNRSFDIMSIFGTKHGIGNFYSIQPFYIYKYKDLKEIVYGWHIFTQMKTRGHLHTTFIQKSEGQSSKQSST